MNFRNFKVPYQTDERYSKRIAYFSMEYAVHNALKIYSGGLGFLAGSHMRSAYELRQNLIALVFYGNMVITIRHVTRIKHYR